MEEVIIRQKPSPLEPILPEHDYFTAGHWSIILAIADAVVPSFTTGNCNKFLQHSLRNDVYEAGCARLEQVAGPESTVVASYLAESATSNPQFRDIMSRTLNINMPEQTRKELAIALSTLK